MVTTNRIKDGLMITLPDGPGDPAEDEVRGEALRWLRELNETSGSDPMPDGGGRLTPVNTARVLHRCLPPQAYLGKDDAPMWRCPGCGATWRFSILAEGQSFGAGGGAFVWGKWVPERMPGRADGETGEERA
jgi:hypothetical protein